jgi:hypothetical protein
MTLVAKVVAVVEEEDKVVVAMVVVVMMTKSTTMQNNEDVHCCRDYDDNHKDLATMTLMTMMPMIMTTIIALSRLVQANYSILTNRANSMCHRPAQRHYRLLHSQV